MTSPLLPPADFSFLRDFLRDRMGYVLEEGKEYLIDSRLHPIAASFGLDSVSALVAQLRKGPSFALAEAVVEAMTIGETSFFRTEKIYENLREIVIPKLKAARAMASTLRIWCAACSTGQEPYSIAMTLADHFPELAGWSIEILATDLSKRAIDQAAAGRYNHFEVQRGLPIQLLLKHFRQQDNHWVIADPLRRRVRFQLFNLLDPFDSLGGPFDIVFLRNVLIYFEIPTKRGIFAKLHRTVAPDGYLVLGESESVVGLTDVFEIRDRNDGFFTPVRGVR